MGNENFALVAVVAVVLLCIVLIIVFKYEEYRQRKLYLQKLEKVHIMYMQSLKSLKMDPSNPEKRERALKLGREYSALTRQRKLVTVYDEVKIKNDLDAACAGVAVNNVKGVVPIKQRLEELQNLFFDGLISEEELQIKKKKLLEEL